MINDEPALAALTKADQLSSNIDDSFSFILDPQSYFTK
tara:strand:- start:9 stop:122 length:114 start_codon:yes stop_codon:yes gene_type:complete